MNRRLGLSIATIGILAALAAVAVAQEKAKPIASFRAFGVNQGRTTANAGVVQITITRWSTDEEREKLISTLKEKGSDALLNTLTSLKPVGFIKMPNTLGWDLYYAREQDNPDGGRSIYLASNRRLAFGEVKHQSRSSQYAFTLVEMHLDKDGKGEGKLSGAAKVEFNSKTHQLDIENYSALPTDLKNITTEKP